MFQPFRENRDEEPPSPELKPALWPMPQKYRVIEEVDLKLRQVIRQLIAGKLPWPLLLLGEAGTGKSCAGMCLVDNCGGSIYVTMNDFARALSDVQFDRIPFFEYDGGSGHRSEGALWKDWSDANVCVLDEVGSRGRVSDHEFNAIRKALDMRVDTPKPLVIISNLTAEQIGVCYDDRIKSRLCQGTIIDSKGDRRLQAAQKRNDETKQGEQTSCPPTN